MSVRVRFCVEHSCQHRCYISLGRLCCYLLLVNSRVNKEHCGGLSVSSYWLFSSVAGTGHLFVDSDIKCDFCSISAMLAT
jgi:hypothetical protein